MEQVNLQPTSTQYDVDPVHAKEYSIIDDGQPNLLNNDTLYNITLIKRKKA